MLGRLGRWCHNHRAVVIVAWIVALVGLGAVSGAAGNAFTTKFELPNVESHRGLDLLDQHFAGKGGGQTGQIVYHAPQGVQDQTVKAEMSAYFDKVGQIKADETTNVSITSPYTPAGARNI